MRAEFVIHDPAIQMIVWPLMAVPIIYFAGRLAGHIHFPAVRNAARSARICGAAGDVGSACPDDAAWC